MRPKRTKLISSLLFLTVFVVVIYLRYFDNYKVFTSQCKCRANERIQVKGFIMNNYKSFEVSSNLANFMYRVDENILEETTCDMFNVLRRGLKQKVIGFSLYGKNKKYYNLLKGLYSIHVHLKAYSCSIMIWTIICLTDISRLSKKMYPDWIVRVYHDNSIAAETKCEIECLRDDSGDLIDNVDFCNVEYMPPNKNVPNVILPEEKKISDLFWSAEIFYPWNASHVHGMVCNQLLLIYFYQKECNDIN